MRKRIYTYCFPYTFPLFRNVRPPPNRRGRRPRRPLGCHMIWRYMGGERLVSGYRLGRLKYITQPFATTYQIPSSPVVGEGVLTLPLAVRRETAVRMGGLYNPSFRKPRPKGGRGRPPLQPEWDGCGICRRAYRHTRYDARAGIVIRTFLIVLRKGRRGRRPLRLGGERTFQQPYNAVASGSPRGVGDAAPYGVIY